MNDRDRGPRERETILAELRRLREEVRAVRDHEREQAFKLNKWGRLLNSLIADLEDKGITSRSELMLKVYERLKDSGAMETGQR